MIGLRICVYAFVGERCNCSGVDRGQLVCAVHVQYVPSSYRQLRCNNFPTLSRSLLVWSALLVSKKSLLVTRMGSRRAALVEGARPRQGPQAVRQ